MSEASLAEPKSAEYYISEVQRIFRQNDCSHVSVVEELGAFFSDSFRPGLSHISLKNLKTCLKQGVTDLSKEVDQMVEPVLGMHKITSSLKDKERGVVSSLPSKKQKSSSSSTPISTPTCSDSSIGPQSSTQGSGSDTVVSDESGRKGGKGKRCSNCSSPTTPQWRVGPSGAKTLCNACGIRYKKQKAASDAKGAEEDTESVNDYLLTLLEDGGMQAKAALYKHNDELAKQLEHMEQKLEEVLDIVVSKCRQMNIVEKQQLRNLIQTLSPKNLDRVVQIIKRRKLPKGGQSFYELNIDLDKEDNGTLWRLYYYVRAAENAKRLSLAELQQGKVVVIN
ncbi:GATA zinc finger domain-containing protein 11-like [Papaver somniferum]|uniref:GATA zinc finger domain-containing protein 11-like n=1 Tax=Papaver somniferum TaxID=3469 RepID=UPI000E6F4AF3|nr:GATA zinc finger domain-containing protein 11-like [Papaver somniferum]XP_026394321.1 GATA zinc finger domain-containing protein 11-like [Papaver somniferum]XP_026394322.1 GATA zinc finger domain-containing protein 11-like [Papaver somniferum]XP_026394323.1 GATA zinc finger domain-containing protein 11-like [Papaver somniferum]XP_026394324.1 GATA zinc finger domain-containing protein 11-like [Papaver somniferum]XP_026394325.1 GATA zinc finger domain-containing protein 11-like [Papaver somni